MRIKDKKFVQSELKRLCWIDTYLLHRCGEECLKNKVDQTDDTILCVFSDGEDSWFPISCVEDLHDPKDPMKILPEGTIAPVKNLRDEFAMAAMETMLLALLDSATKLDEVKLGETSYKVANAMMEARKK